jgi:hypothetical protein
MDRVFKSGASATPPSPPSSPSVGYAVGGDPGLGTPATKPGPYWYHMITESLRRLLVASGLTPDHTNLDQVTLAVQELIRQAAGDYKASVRVATTANITALNGGAPNTLDGVALVASDRILVKDQTTASQNGIYVVTNLGTGANGTWSRAGDADSALELNSGAIVTVEEGTSNADSQWMLTTSNPITLGSTALTFAKPSGGAQYKDIQSITSSVAANALTLGLNPTTLDFRSASLTSGVPNTRSNGAAISLVVPSGATLGTVSGQAARLVLIAIDNAGTMELAVVNLTGGNNLDETTLISTTAISAGATAANVIYSTTARSSVPFRVVGFIDITETTAGTWASDATTKQGMGGQAMTAMQSLGFGQTWQTVTRNNGVTYYNTTGKPILLIFGQSSASPGSFTLVVNGVTLPQIFGWSTGSAMGGGSIIIPVGASYSINCPVGTAACAELR